MPGEINNISLFIPELRISCGDEVQATVPQVEKEMGVIRGALGRIGYLEGAARNGFELRQAPFGMPWQGVRVELSRDEMKLKFDVGFSENAPGRMDNRQEIVVRADRKYGIHEPTKKLIDEFKAALEMESRRLVRIITE